jgi:hypothetical protein
VFRWAGGGFVSCGSLPLPGAEHLEFLRIGGRRFVAGASIRTGRGPYEMNVHSWIREWHAPGSTPFQSIATYGAKHWHHFRVGARIFLALAQGVVVPGPEPLHPRTSRLYEWDGAAFADFQTMPGRWGYAFHAFEIQGEHYLAYADHLERSVVYRWENSRYEEFHALPGGGGRAFALFRLGGTAYLAYANIQRGVEIHRFDAGRFVLHQTLGEAGARTVTVLEHEKTPVLVVGNFIRGTPAAPTVLGESQLYRWQDGLFVIEERFRTSGATHAAAFEVDGVPHLAVANSLDCNLRFRTDTVIYRFEDTEGNHP